MQLGIDAAKVLLSTIIASGIVAVFVGLGLISEAGWVVVGTIGFGVVAGMGLDALDRQIGATPTIKEWANEFDFENDVVEEVESAMHGIEEIFSEVTYEWRQGVHDTKEWIESGYEMVPQR